jgi:hypothetical protein
MSWPANIRTVGATTLAALVACPPAHGLISLSEGRERIFVNATVSVTRDSNIFANSDNQGDFVYATSLGADYSRRVGWIAVNANAAVASSRFASVRGQDFDNPSFGLEFTKQTGRTTGALTLSAARESRADASVNVRSTSWNIPIGLNFKYPIFGPYTMAGSFGYSSRKYLDDAVFASLSTFTSSFDLYRILSSERDLVLGYRYRYSDTSRSSSYTDNAFSLGLSGKFIRGVKGNLRAGYQVRETSGRAGGDSRLGSWFISGGPSYSFTKKLGLDGTISKDISTTATDSIVDTTNASLVLQRAFTSRWNGKVGVDFGDTRFLGDSGRVLVSAGPPPQYGPNRHDNYLSAHAMIAYTLNDHLKMSLSYTWFQNWSTLAYADFVRSSWGFTASTRW